MKAAEIVASSSMAAGCTLRFPRVESVRADRSPADCTSMEELAALRRRAEGKLFGHAHLQEGGEEPRPRKRAREERGPGLGARFLAQDLQLTRVDSLSLRGQVVVVEPSDLI